MGDQKKIHHYSINIHQTHNKFHLIDEIVIWIFMLYFIYHYKMHDNQAIQN